MKNSMANSANANYYVTALGNNVALAQVASIQIQPGSVLTLTPGNSLVGPVDLIHGVHTMHIAEGHSLSNCTIEVAGDNLHITQLEGGLAE